MLLKLSSLNKLGLLLPASSQYVPDVPLTASRQYLATWHPASFGSSAVYTLVHTYLHELARGEVWNRVLVSNGQEDNKHCYLLSYHLLLYKGSATLGLRLQAVSSN